LESKQATFARLATRPGRSFSAFRAERIPLSAGLAFALPAAESSTAVLADKGQAALGHRESPQIGRAQRYGGNENNTRTYFKKRLIFRGFDRQLPRYIRWYRRPRLTSTSYPIVSAAAARSSTPIMPPMRVIR